MEKIVEETMKEFQTSLFINFFETGKLDWPQDFIETKIISEFLKEDNVSVYNFCNNLKLYQIQIEAHYFIKIA